MTTSIAWQKSSYSGGGDGNTCIEIAWQKSSYSAGGDGNDCVELAAAHATIHLRESDDPEVILTTTPTALRALLLGIKSGEFDHLAI